MRRWNDGKLSAKWGNGTSRGQSALSRKHLGGVSRGNETDLRLTRDGRVILCHDDNTSAYAEMRCKIEELDFDELRKLNMATSFNLRHFDRTPIFATAPSLEEALELFRGQERVRLSLQPKVPGALETAEKVIRAMRVPEELLGFNDGNLTLMTEARLRFPASTIFYDIHSTRFLDSDLYVSRHHHFQNIVVFRDNLSSEVVSRIHDAGIVPGVWSVDNPGELDRYLAMGIQRFYTNVPAVLLAKLNQTRSGNG